MQLDIGTQAVHVTYSNNKRGDLWRLTTHGNSLYSGAILGSLSESVRLGHWILL
jgi:hypothetical protein